jgi:hypothetical protein
MTKRRFGLILKPLKAGSVIKKCAQLSLSSFLAHFPLWFTLEKGYRAMSKTLEAINEAIRNPKHPFRKTDNHPKKAVKHRYERRKIREYLQLTDWLAEEAI